MKKKITEPEIKARFEFLISLRFELFYGMQVMVDEQARIHPRWRNRKEQLSTRFHQLLAELNGGPIIWALIADTLPAQPATLTFEQIINTIKSLPLAQFQARILNGAIHQPELVNSLISTRPGKTGKSALATALARVPKAKQEWLAFINLYPYQVDSPMVVALEQLLRAPERFRELTIELLKIFWQEIFQESWQLAQPQLQRSLEEKERLFVSAPLTEFFHQILLYFEFDPVLQTIKANRGGYKLALSDVQSCYLIPSLFNDKRYWHAYDEEKPATVYFPYFDPAITIELQPPKESLRLQTPELDPALILKALGDATRFAIVTILAKQPMKSIELAEVMSVSKPTISHHIHLLRESGLINEQYTNGAVLLSLKREVIADLSRLLINRLYLSDQEIADEPRRTRRTRSLRD